MKKLLALVLALVMSMSLVTISNAAFSDADKIDHTEAVEVMNALGVINGMPDGSFAPAGNVTRAEMAKMITIIMLGDIDAAAFKGTTTDLTDINGHWAEGYIKYCYSQGVIAGRGDGTFAPNANVTAVEAAKMLLVAIGYNADVQGYVGGDWAINIIRDAQLSKFFDDLSVTSTKVLTRDEAAQMIYNAVNALLIVKEPSLNINTGNITYNYRVNNSSKTLLTETFDVKTTVGILNDWTYDPDKSEWDYDFTAISGAAPAAKMNTTVDYTDLFGQNVKALWTTDKNNNTKIYGIFAHESSVLAEGYLGQLDVSKLADKTVKVGSTSYKSTGTTLVYRAFGAAAAAAPTFNQSGHVNFADAYTMKLIDNTGDGKADLVVYVPFVLSKVTYVGSKAFNFNAVTFDGSSKSSLKFEDIKSYSGVAKKDNIVIVAAANSVTEQVEVAKAEVISGKVVKVNGTKAMIGDTYYPVLDGQDKVLGTSYDAVVVNGYILSTGNAKTDVSIKNYAVLVAAEAAHGALNTKPQGKLLLTDGTTKTVDVAGNYTSLKGQLVTFEVEDDVYTLTAATTDTTASSADFCGWEDYAAASGSYAYSSTKGYGTINSNAIADDAVIYFYNSTKDTYKVMTGAEFKKVTSAGVTVNNAYGSKDGSTGLTTVEFAFVTKAGAVETESDATYAYLLAAPVAVQDKDKHTVYELSVWTKDGEATLTTKYVNAAFDAQVAALAKGTAFSYKTTDDKVSAITNAQVAAVTAYDGKAITFAKGSINPTAGTATNGDTVATYLKDTTIIYVDRDGSTLTGLTDGEIQLAIETSTSGTYYANAAYVLSTTADGDGVYPVKVLFVEVSNNWFDVTIA